MSSKEGKTAPEEALAAKQAGNDAYKNKDYSTAIQKYTQAISIAPKSDAAALCLCNRAICHGILKNWTESARDAKACVELKPEWVKGYQRLAIALRKQGQLMEAVQALEGGVAANPQSEELKASLEQAKKRLSKSLSSGIGGTNSSSSGGGNAGAAAQQAIQSIQKEMQQLQIRASKSKSKLNETNIALQKAQKDHKRASITLQELAGYPDETNVYNQVGKAFVRVQLGSARTRLQGCIKTMDEKKTSLTKRREHLTTEVKNFDSQVKEMVRAFTRK